MTARCEGLVGAIETVNHELRQNRSGKIYECITAKQKDVELRKGPFWLDDET